MLDRRSDKEGEVGQQMHKTWYTKSEDSTRRWKKRRDEYDGAVTFAKPIIDVTDTPVE
jgi:hypothetical protein